MEATTKIAQEIDVPCQVLAGKPMACGIGACFSCVRRSRHRRRLGLSPHLRRRAVFEAGTWNSSSPLKKRTGSEPIRENSRGKR